MKKTIIKILSLLICIAVMMAGLAIPAFASEPIGCSESESSMEIGEDTEESFFELIYNFAVENCEEIFSFLAFIGSLFIAFIYKNKLLPSVKEAVGCIGSNLKKISESGEAVSAEARAQGELLLSYSERLETVSSELSRLSAELDKLVAGDGTRGLYALIETQVELLREIFMSSSLPHYQKEAVETKINRIKEALKNEKEQK